MNDVPTWLIEILRQFPMVVFIGFAVWWTYNRLERREMRQEELMKERERRQEEANEKLRLEVRRAADAEIERADKRLKDAIADKNKEVARIADRFSDELRTLTTKVDQLTRKLSG